MLISINFVAVFFVAFAPLWPVLKVWRMWTTPALFASITLENMREGDQFNEHIIIFYFAIINIIAVIITCYIT